MADGFEFDPVALKQKYDEERDKRLALRPEGLAQYREPTGALAHYGVDPYTPVAPREPRRVDTDVVVVGGGFGGMLAAARLSKAGIDDFLITERGGDFGGTWYWNRYPGAQCDVESYIYLPLIEEVGTVPSERYAHQPEIFAHCQAFGRTFDLYRRALMHTRVTDARWDEASSRWIVETDRGDELRSRFVILASGHYGDPKLPGIPGMEKFQGASFHTSRWDYACTGGAPGERMDALGDKVVAIIGTGATAIQCVPEVAKDAGHLYVIQRTPSSVGVRDNRPTDVAWFSSQPPGWQLERMVNFVEGYRGIAAVDLIQDGWGELTRRMQPRMKPGMSMEELLELVQMIDYEIMEDVRKRCDAVVRDPATADALKPWYNWMCKRPCFHDEYLDAFNRDNVTLVDTQGKGVERITERSIVVNGQEIEVDVIVFATGFELNPYDEGTPIPVTGRDGRTLDGKWKDGATTLHGHHVHGFPNFFLSTTRQASWDNNFTYPLDVTATHLAQLIRHVIDEGIDTVEVTEDVEADWVRFHEERSVPLQQKWAECTPSYFNLEGRVDQRVMRNGSFNGPIMELRDIFASWRNDGFPGLTMTKR